MTTDEDSSSVGRTDHADQFVRLCDFRNLEFSRGRSAVVEALWLVLSSLLMQSSLPGSFHRRLLLRIFGAQIGRGVVIRKGVKVKFPWRLRVGDCSWIGEDAWIDNLAAVEICANCCISQGAYLCTGNHDWSRPTFDLKGGGIRIEEGAWVAARAVVGPNVVVGRAAILTLGSVATKSLDAWTINMGNPAVVVGWRKLRRSS